MGRLGFSAAIAAIVVSGGCVYGQVPPKPGQVMSRQQLEQLQKESDQRLQTMHLNLGHPVPQNQVHQPHIYPIKGLWVCKDVKEFEPIYAKPDKNSPIVARTTEYEAVGGKYVHGFAYILINDKISGYVQLKYVSPFYDKLSPSTTCQVVGVTANGSPDLDIR
ncbi:MAG: hypothetical protein PHI71_12605 [Acidiphilium sp.]|nr:hypothetical protein [Acidiphilium sp.]